MEQAQPYIPVHKVRIVTAASLFDGHDAAINIMRRIIQSTGVEVIHLGHDRSVEEVVNTAIERMVDIVSTERRPELGQIKDIAGAAVFIGATVAAIVGVLIFLPKIIDLIF